MGRKIAAAHEEPRCLSPMETNGSGVAFESLTTWQQLAPASADAPAAVSTSDDAPFRVRESVNRKIALWHGQLWTLRVDAIVNSTSESLRETSGICRKILDAAGKQIWVECEAAGQCRTGEAVITRGCRLPARKIIHTVGPRYNLKYHNAAENALHMCYRSVLVAAKEESLRTVAFSCIYTRKKGYPREEAAHIAARTIRRFLEHYEPDFDLVVLCVDSLEDQAIYECVLPLYFPRTPAEERRSRSLQSRDLGNEFGEPIIEERKIRIGSWQQSEENNNADEADQDSEDEESAIQDFREMSADPDVERLERLQLLQEERQRLAQKTLEAQQKAELRNYQAALAKAQREDFADLKAMGFLYNAGVDHSGSPVIVYLGSNLPVDQVDLDRVMLFVIHVMDAIVENRYSILYVHNGVKTENQPTAAWLKRLFRTFSSKYQANLRFFYILEPTIWLKFVLLVAKGFVSGSFYKKIVYMSRSKEIDNISASLKLPEHVYKREPANQSEENEDNNMGENGKHQDKEQVESNQDDEFPTCVSQPEAVL